MNKKAEQRSRHQIPRSGRSALKPRPPPSTSDPERGSEASATNVDTHPKDSIALFHAPVSTDWTQQAVCAFFHDYVIDIGSQGRVGNLEFLPQLYQQQSEKPYFVEILNAVSMASFANRASIDHMRFRARRSYGRALSLVNAMLSDAEEVKSDEALTSIHLIGMYEIISGDKPTLWAGHHAGQRALIRLRGPTQFTSQRGRALYRLIHIILQLQSLHYRHQPLSTPDVAFDTLYPTPHSAKLAELLLEVTKLKRTVTGPAEWDEDAIALDQKMQSWSDSAPEGLRFRPVPVENTLLRIRYPERIWIFKGIQMANARNIFTCARIYLLQAMLDYRARLPLEDFTRSPLPSEASIRQCLREFVGDICATVPFMLGEIDNQGALNFDGRRKAIGAYYLLWPLHVAATVKDLPAAQAVWIADRLFYIGHVAGIKQALLLKSYMDEGMPGG